jgi:hypothetical protein
MFVAIAFHTGHFIAFLLSVIRCLAEGRGTVKEIYAGMGPTAKALHDAKK